LEANLCVKPISTMKAAYSRSGLMLGLGGFLPDRLRAGVRF
jgi:hypothetical protein